MGITEIVLCIYYILHVQCVTEENVYANPDPLSLYGSGQVRRHNQI